ncbi:MAG: DUF397 domain-containing protein [Pseudonocardiales bacterium]
MERPRWRKSSYSGGGGSACVEVADLPGSARAVRDSKDPTGPALIVTPSAWTAFTTSLRDGAFS